MRRGQADPLHSKTRPARQISDLLPWQPPARTDYAA